MRFLLKLMPVLFLVVLAGSCRKDEDNMTGGGPSAGSTVTADFIGFVKDNAGNPLAGAIVTAGDKTAMTNSTGGYKISNAIVNKSRAVITVSKAGYWQQQKASIPESLASNTVNVVMYPDNKAFSINAANGGNVNLPGGTVITFPPSAFALASGGIYSGTVSISANEILTSEDDFGSKIPGGDFLARDAAGNSQMLISYGMTGLKMYDASGTELFLAAGAQAQVKMPINPAQAAAAPATIPLWYYNEDEKIWMEEGTATKNGSFYSGSVSHFTWWNCDFPNPGCNVTVSITDCSGNPLANIPFEIFGLGSHALGWTNSNGTETAPVPANATMTLTIQLSTLAGATDTTFTIGPFAPGSNNTVNYQLTNCNSVLVNLTDCDGVPVNGTVAVFNNGVYINIFNTVNGSVLINSLATGNFTFHAASAGLTGVDSTIINGAASQNSSLTIALCDTVQTGPNNFNITITSATLGTLNLSYSQITAECQLTGVLKNVKLYYYNQVSQDSVFIQMRVPAYLPGSYTWNSSNCIVTGGIKVNGMTINFNTNGPGAGAGYTNLVATPPVGSNVSGEFSGVVYMTVNWVAEPAASVNAIFDVLRIQ